MDEKEKERLRKARDQEEARSKEAADRKKALTLYKVYGQDVDVIAYSDEHERKVLLEFCKDHPKTRDIVHRELIQSDLERDGHENNEVGHFTIIKDDMGKRLRYYGVPELINETEEMIREVHKSEMTPIDPPDLFHVTVKSLAQHETERRELLEKLSETPQIETKKETAESKDENPPEPPIKLKASDKTVDDLKEIVKPREPDYSKKSLSDLKKVIETLPTEEMKVKHNKEKEDKKDE